jgi:hypothetical protein
VVASRVLIEIKAPVWPVALENWCDCGKRKTDL